MNQFFLRGSRRGLASLSQSKLMKFPYRLDKLKLTLDVAKPYEFKDIAALTAKNFCKDDPVAKAAGCLPEDFYDLAMNDLKQSKNTCLSFALKNDSSEIVSALIVEDFPFTESHQDPSARPLHSKYDVVFALLGQMRSSFRTYYKENKLTGKVGILSLGLVSDEYKGKNLLLHMINAVATTALASGFSHCFGEFTNMFSQRSALQAGMKKIYSIPYDSFVFNGKKPFQGLNNAMTDYANSKVGKKKFSNLAPECILMYAPFIDVLNATSSLLNLH